MMKLRKNKKGFTLVEMIVVIAIVAVLASILIPTLVGYIEDAKKANDKTIARTMYDRVQEVLATDWDAYQSFYNKHTTGNFICTEDGYCYKGWSGSPSSNEYRLVIVCRINGAPAKDQNRDCYKWQWANGQHSIFTAAYNQNLGLSTNDGQKWLHPHGYWTLTEHDGEEMLIYKNSSKFIYNMKVTSHENGQTTDRWLVGYRKDNPNLIEIWAGSSYGAGGSGTYCRIYPDPCDDYK